jgi:hypothetical protein
MCTPNKKIFKKKYSNKYLNNGHPSVRARVFYQAAPKHELIDIA